MVWCVERRDVGLMVIGSCKVSVGQFRHRQLGNPVYIFTSTGIPSIHVRWSAPSRTGILQRVRQILEISLRNYSSLSISSGST